MFTVFGQLLGNPLNYVIHMYITDYRLPITDYRLPIAIINSHYSNANNSYIKYTKIHHDVCRDMKKAKVFQLWL